LKLKTKRILYEIRYSVIFRAFIIVELKFQFVPRREHFVWVIKTSQLMLYREIIAVCSEIHTKHINTPCGQNVEFVNVKPGGTYSYYWALKKTPLIPRSKHTPSRL
jgi:hypothetical protein